MQRQKTKQEMIFEDMPLARLFARCAFPNMISMAVVSLYTIADGIFVGRFIGADALAAVNLVMPVIMIAFALSDMIAVGSSVQIAIHLGEKKIKEAGRIFSFCSLLIIMLSFITGVIGFFGAAPLISLMGADAGITALGTEYIRVFAVFAPLIMIFFAVDNYLRVCGHTHYSMIVNVISAVINIILDYVFLGIMDLGIGYAAFATCIGMSLGTILAFTPFLRKKLPLVFTKGVIRMRLLINILYNGSSEFFSNIASSLLMLIINSVLLHISGSLAVAAFSVVLYVDSIVVSMMYGITDSMQPPISYCYGAGLKKRLFALEKCVLAAGAVLSLAAFVCMRTFGRDLIVLFTGENAQTLLDMSLGAMTLFSLTYLVMWMNAVLSAFFTAVDRPGTSLAISLGRSLFFPLAMLAPLVYSLGLDGVWLTPVSGNILAAVLAVSFFIRFLRRASSGKWLKDDPSR